MTDATQGSREWQRRFMRGVEWGLRDIVDAVLEEGDTIIGREAVNNGDLLKSSERERRSRVEYWAKWTAAHAPYVEFGTRPHWPPLAPILAWVEKNARIGDDGALVLKSAGRKSRSKSFREAQLRVARAIQAKIAKEGTKPIRYATRAASIVQPKAAGLMANAVRASLQKGGDASGA